MPIYMPYIYMPIYNVSLSFNNEASRAQVLSTCQ